MPIEHPDRNVKGRMIGDFEVNTGDIIYYVKAYPNVEEFEIVEIIVDAVTNDYFVGCIKDDVRRMLFGFNDKYLNKMIYNDRKQAMKVLRKAVKFNYDIKKLCENNKI